METAALVEQLQPWRVRHERLGWRPSTIDGDWRPTATKFGGTPLLIAGEPWPHCPSCGQALSFFVQVNLDELPPELDKRYGSGLLQLFYCDLCHSGTMPGERQFVRIVPTVTMMGAQLPLPGFVETFGPLIPAPTLWPGGTRFPAKTVVEWLPIRDLPDPGDHGALGVSYTYDHDIGTCRLDCPELDLSISEIRHPDLAETVGEAAGGDKLAGWPRWVQGPAYYHCARCGQQMHLVFQLDSNDHLPYMFGDLGRDHITQCPSHLDILAFDWDCH